MPEPSGPRATFPQRLAAAFIDGIPLSLIGLAIRAALHTSAAGPLVYWLIGLVYFGYFEGTPSGQTVGKRILSIRVVDANTGESIGHVRAVLRVFARIVSAVPCLLGYVWMLWDREKQCWHDKLITDVVVPTSDYPVERWPG